uniref:Uncharacterized protein n=1 Tax=Avena sativa TaxID=4498 RepID=A0ACD5UNQ3_AVESA
MAPPVDDAEAPRPHVVEDCRGVLQLLSDGTTLRSATPPPHTVEDRDDGLVPAFDSKTPTQSELVTTGTAYLSRAIAERYSRLALPVGANKGHPMLNPLGRNSPSLEVVGGRMLVIVGADDMLKDNQVRYVEQMKAVGNDVELVVFAGKEHSFFSNSPWSETGTEVIRVIGQFMDRDTADSA